jgi:hypothetical protein
VNETFRDDDGTFPLGVELNYETTHQEIKKYDIRTDDSGKLPIAYESDIQQGTAQLEISAGGMVVKEVTFGGSDKFELGLQPNTDYTLKIIFAGKGDINLRWMELA